MYCGYVFLTAYLYTYFIWWFYYFTLTFIFRSFLLENMEKSLQNYYCPFTFTYLRGRGRNQQHKSKIKAPFRESKQWEPARVNLRLASLCSGNAIVFWNCKIYVFLDIRWNVQHCGEFNLFIVKMSFDNLREWNTVIELSWTYCIANQ